MKDKIKNYREKLENEIAEYLELPVNQRSADAVFHMVECWEHVTEMEHALEKCHNPTITDDDIKSWNLKMVNADGSHGGHWTVEQTTPLASSTGVVFEHISPICWNVAVNMMYSDYQPIAVKFNVNKPEFYCELSKAFLFDADGGSPRDKLAAYYYGIVKK